MKELYFKNYINELYQNFNSEHISKFDKLSKLLLSLKKIKKN